MYPIALVTNYIIINQLGGAKRKWTTLEHNGVMFPPEYEKHNVPVIYNGQEIILEKDAEEAATLYAKYIETDYVKSKIFNKNFWNDWKKILGKNRIIQSIDDCDFRLIYNYLLDKKEAKKSLPKDDSTKEDEEKYKFAIVDGKQQPVGNFRIEPPGIFLGRGCNPKLGRIKRRIYPEDIIINIGVGAKVPDPLPGHKWKDVVHDRTVEWLAMWRDDITRKNKYVWLGAQSDFKANSDMQKFDLARKLKKKIKEIRQKNEELLNSNDPFNRQIATALYFIDKFALRVGNEKGSDEETDTVGVTSLRVEHIQLLDNFHVKLDFLGKDSVRYNRILEVEPQVYNNLKEFKAGKTDSEQLFDLINSNDVNKYLQTFMKKLTAKVFRTYNASNLFQKELNKINKKFDSYTRDDKINLLLDEFNKANAKVALLCNHQKNITKSTNKQIENLDKMIKNAKVKLNAAKKSKKKNPVRITKMKDMLKRLKAKKSLKTELKNISIGTSKVNYIDPKIAISFIKRHNIPIDKIFSKTLQEKFKWAMDVDENFVF